MVESDHPPTLTKLAEMGRKVNALARGEELAVRVRRVRLSCEVEPWVADVVSAQASAEGVSVSRWLERIITERVSRALGRARR